jgi:hypothetical protein
MLISACVCARAGGGRRCFAAVTRHWDDGYVPTEAEWVSFSPDGKWLGARLSGGDVRLWDAGPQPGPAASKHGSMPQTVPTTTQVSA